MDTIKSLGIADKIGYSIYGPEESLRYERLYKPDFIQVPFSLMDRRILRNGWLERQFNKNIKIHARSIFLQGLLLLPINNIPSKFKYWNPQFVKLSEWLLDYSISPVSACLNYVASNPLIDKVVFGVDNLAQLKEIIASYNPEIPLDYVDIAVEDERLLLPFNWNNL
jgi:aryl-alcohol dehydrogenase-like predicted oxidoreductase